MKMAGLFLEFISQKMADEESIAVENEEGIFEINISEIKKAKTYLEW